MIPQLIAGVGVYYLLQKAGILPASLPALPSVDSITEALQNPAATLEDIEGQVQTLVGTTPSAADQYMPMILSSAHQYGIPSIVIVAIGWQESRWGASTRLDQPGPGGAGDFYARTPGTSSHWEKVPNVTLTMTPPTKVTRSWTWDKKTNPPQVVIPNDGRGWGRGLMQLDWQLAQTVQWDDAATNIDNGANVFANDLKQMQSTYPQLSQATQILCALAAYNGGASRVITSVNAQIAAGAAESDIDPDVTASGANLTTTDAKGYGYAFNVMNFITSWGGLDAVVS
jgi:hypothetical protein